MEKGKIVKLISLNLGIVVLNVILFSPGLVGMGIGSGSIFDRALALTIIIMSVILFIAGNYMLIVEKKQKVKVREMETVFDYINALEQNKDKKVFTKDIRIIFEQMENWEKKKGMVKDLLLQKFSSTELSYGKFSTVIEELEKVFYMNIRSIINKINIFDQEDYDELKRPKAKESFSKDFIEAKMSIYNQYIDYVKDSMADNEEILLKLDRLLLELSKFNSLDEGELEKMTAMEEIDELIAKARFYK